MSKEISEAGVNSSPIEGSRLREERLTNRHTQISPEDLLIKVSELSGDYMPAPLEAVADGTFAGNGKLHIEDGKVVLIRHANDKSHLTKDGQPATQEQMRVYSEIGGGDSSGAGTIHATANIENIKGFPRYPIYGVLRIPIEDFISLAEEGKLIVGSMGEAEIVLSGDIAEQYLEEIHIKEGYVDPWPDTPKEIIDFDNIER
jgi:hypothetical protein